ncbi:Dna-directed rna polymerase ii subunit rpb7 [Thalictrum thalictroides]|uniref:DNA-directed RNA polymerase subunit n=1 Tax=Thalictrum thalictroides TaxID=46969 RepID=A0A7J6VJR7_THATH|nr:Dna-directed rna polymerase ii subunit rpb7 [Thalictrum thalictroides]
MFSDVTLGLNIQLHPRFIGPHVQDYIVGKLIEEVQGTCCDGYSVVTIIAVDEIGKGRIRDDGSGLTTYPVKYQCKVFQPVEGEIMDVVVTKVTKMGFFSQDEDKLCTIFVSDHLIPDDMEFQRGEIPYYLSSDGSVKIQEYTQVRLKIVGSQVDDAKGFFCIGSLRDDFLGVISDAGGAVDSDEGFEP